jgi:hypothetical protein
MTIWNGIFKNDISVSNESLQNYYYIGDFDILYYNNPLMYHLKTLLQNVGVVH